jgi:hypothetical protein
MTAGHQQWMAAFVNHVRASRAVSRGLLETVTEFVASQADLHKAALLAAGEALMRASESTATFAASGHNYWSPDVAQHHQYRGQGHIDKERLVQRQAEAERVAVMVEELKTFDGLAN